MTTLPVPVKIFVVDDHSIFREGLVELLDDEEDMVVIGHADNASDAISKMLAHPADILLLDIDLPGLSSFAAAEILLRQQPDLRIIFVSAFANEFCIDQALEHRAWGYVTKAAPFEVLLQAIREVAGGWIYYTPEIKARIAATPDGPRLATRRTSVTTLLSQRELEVLRYVADAMSIKEIAALMHISAKTVEHHRARIMSKLGIHDAVGLLRYAIRENVIAE